MHNEIPHRYIDAGTLTGPTLQQIIADAEKHIEVCRSKIRLGRGYCAGDLMLQRFAEDMERHAITALRARTILDQRTIARSTFAKTRP